MSDSPFHFDGPRLARRCIFLPEKKMRGKASQSSCSAPGNDCGCLKSVASKETDSVQLLRERREKKGVAQRWETKTRHERISSWILERRERMRLFSGRAIERVRRGLECGAVLERWGKKCLINFAIDDAREGWERELRSWKYCFLLKEASW